MAIRYEEAHAVLKGDCMVEEAGDFAEWLIAQPGRTVDLAPCTRLHSAILQSLMALRPPIVAAPADPQLARWLGPVLPVSPPSPPGPNASAKPTRARSTTPRRSKKAAKA